MILIMRSSVPDKLGKEWFLGQIGIMILQQLFRSENKLHCGQFEASGLELDDNVPHQVTMDSIWFQEDQSLFIIFDILIQCWRSGTFSLALRLGFGPLSLLLLLLFLFFFRSCSRFLGFIFRF
jgi:hypothetical protein